ncbi:MAG: YdeI/OmpD-associated family protein [Bdellovibrionales bacterium]|nr:YdeI/OmpD-associated family protein [Bdellovibrionales bacterium]
MTTKKNKPAGPLHKVPTDLGKALNSTSAIKAAWKDLTPLARNEWICWVTSAKKEDTRTKRIKRALEDLAHGKRRPCCWPGCPHRRPSARKWFK